MDWAPVDETVRIAGTLHLSLLALELPGAVTVKVNFGTQNRWTAVSEAQEHGLTFPILDRQTGRSLLIMFQDVSNSVIGSLNTNVETLFPSELVPDEKIPVEDVLAKFQTRESDEHSDGAFETKREATATTERVHFHEKQQWYPVGSGRVLMLASFVPINVCRVTKRPATNPRKHASLFPVYVAPLWQNNEASPSCALCRREFGMKRRRHHCRICGLLTCRECLQEQFVDNTQGICSVKVCLSCCHTFETALYTSVWEPDEASHACRQCLRGFALQNRRSHCRICGFLFCAPCLNPVSIVSGSACGKTAKLCQRCVKELRKNSKGLCWDDSLDRILYNLKCDVWPPPEDCMAEDINPVQAAPLVDRQVPTMNVLILIVGSRGDVQPFIPLAHSLKAYGHRVRLATHKCFREFVTTQGLEFFPLGGDPKELMAYMVKTGGRLLPNSIKEIKEDVPAKRAMIAEIMHSTWLAATTNEPSCQLPVFVADAMISNPPTYGHIHVAEALCVPLHMFFTMPWSPTRAFPHPLANLDNNKGPSNMNYLSFQVVDQLMWMGLSDLVNNFRETIGLDPILMGESGANVLSRHLVPFAYMWSPSLIPKPRDWGTTIDVVGFSFLPGSGAGNWKPSPELLQFLEAGPPPIFVGFGSCVIPNPELTTQLIFDAARLAGVRVIVQRGWSNLGGPFHRPLAPAATAPVASIAAIASLASPTPASTATSTDRKSVV